MSTYGLDLRDVLWGESPYGARRVNALITGLPVNSALSREVDPDQWTQEDELLAAIFDQIGLSNHMFLQANSKKNAHIPEYERFPRPFEVRAERQRRVQSDPDEVRAFLMDPEFSEVYWDAHGAEESN